MREKVPMILKVTWFLITFCTTAFAQPRVLTTIPENSTNFFAAGGFTYFTAGEALWRTDGTAEGTMELATGITISLADSWGSRSNVRAFNDMFYFVAGTKSQLWRSDGTSDGTILLHTSSGHTRILEATGNYLFFSSREAATGQELYRTDGSESGTILLKDIDPGVESGSPNAAGVIGNEFLFRADDTEHGTEVWKSDGTTSGTALVKDVNVDGDGHSTPFAATFDSKYFFGGITPETGLEPWVSDGTPEGTFLLKDAVAGSAGAHYIQYAKSTDDFLFFFLFTEEGPVELWKTQGTTASTEKVKTVWEYESYDTDYHSFVAHDSKLYFFQHLFGDDEYVWVSDGTEDGTRIVLNYNTIDGEISYFDEVNDHLLFAGIFQGRPTGLERLVEGSRAIVHFRKSHWYGEEWDITTIGELAFFADHDQEGSNDGGTPEDPEDYLHLYQTDGVTAQSMRTLFGVSTTGTDNITNFNGKVVFTTQNDQQGSTDLTKRLWIYDPNQAAPVAQFTLVNADTDEDIQLLNDGDVYSKPQTQNINITYSPEGSVGSVVFAINDKRVRIETQSPYSLAGDVNGNYSPWEGAQPDTYKLTATPYSESGGQGAAGEPLTIHFTIEEAGPSACSASGTILREHWANVSGTTVPAIPVDEEPTSISQLTIFEGPVNIGDNYGARIRGYICPPATGAYTFWIASNDHSELWLSTDDNPANRVRIANLTRATNPREWTKFASQRSAPVNLVAGQRYYIEALHKEGIGTDHIAVGWQLPDGTLERPIAGSRLSPANPDDNTAPVVSLTAPNDGETFAAPANITITADASDADGTIAKVEFFEGSNLLFADHNAPFSFDWNNVNAGTYTLTARATDNTASSTTSQPVTITVTGVCTASGTIAREVWNGVQGTSVSDIPQQTPPDAVHALTIFEGPTNSGTNYGARIRGYICPPATGGYTFWIASNDQSELWLSTDDDPANKVRIAWTDRATGEREWNRFMTQRSDIIQLQQGQRYYVEALHKQGIGGDHVAVGWQLPNGTLERPISGSRLSPFEVSESGLAREEEKFSNAGRYSQISVYPNPAQSMDGELTISGYGGIDETVETQVEIVNMTGDVVFKEKVMCGGDCNSYLMKINKQLIPGLYMVNLNANGVRLSKRLLIE